MEERHNKMMCTSSWRLSCYSKIEMQYFNT